jgi:hypothetical protein
MKTMQILKVLTLISMGAALVASCGTLPPGTAAQPAAGTATLPAPGVATDQQPQTAAYPPAALAAQKTAADQLGIGVNAVTIEIVQPMQWPDACLGVAQPDKACAQVVTPGYQVNLKANGQSLVFNTDQDGKQVIEALSGAQNNLPGVISDGKGTPPPQPYSAPQTGAQPSAGDNSRTSKDPPPDTGLQVGIPLFGSDNTPEADLALRLRAEQALITVVSVAPGKFPNACLGIHKGDIACAEGIVNGNVTTLQAFGETYVYHSVQRGGMVTLAQSPAQPGDEELARQALVNFFDLLNQKKFTEAAAILDANPGGNPNPNLDILRSDNPNVPGNDIATLLEQGCTVNGLQCLPVDKISAVESVQSGGYQFTVSFLLPDGSRFSLPQTEGKPAIEQFTYTLVKEDGQFRVLELPPYQS